MFSFIKKESILKSKMILLLLVLNEQKNLKFHWEINQNFPSKNKIIFIKYNLIKSIFRNRFLFD